MPPKGTKSKSSSSKAPAAPATRASAIKAATEKAKEASAKKKAQESINSANKSGAAAARNYTAMAKAEEKRKAAESARRQDEAKRNQLISQKRYLEQQNNKKNKNKNKGKGAGGNSNNEVTLPLPEDPIIPGGGGFDFSTGSIPIPPVRVPDRDNLISLTTAGSNEALLVSVLFEELSAVEIVKFARNDTIDGISPQYNVISNLSEIKTKLDPSYLIAKQRSDTTIDNGFSIRLVDKIPSIDYLFENNIPNYVYFDSTFGDAGSLIIELDNIDVDEIIEVEIDTSGTIEEVR